MRLLLLSLLAALSLGAAPAEQMFVGVISDEMCALNHASMRMGPTDGECATACVEEHDALYVLVHGSDVYKLSDQRAPRAFAGKKVKVVGTLDAATGTIAVTSMAGA